MVIQFSFRHLGDKTGISIPFDHHDRDLLATLEMQNIKATLKNSNIEIEVAVRVETFYQLAMFHVNHANPFKNVTLFFCRNVNHKYDEAWTTNAQKRLNSFHFHDGGTGLVWFPSQRDNILNQLTRDFIFLGCSYYRLAVEQTVG